MSVDDLGFESVVHGTTERQEARAARLHRALLAGTVEEESGIVTRPE